MNNTTINTEINNAPLDTMFDLIVVGSGFAGATIARKMAEKGNRVLVLEKRNHIGGNCYDCLDEHGILVHKYGPHIFHTNDKGVFEFLSNFTEWIDYEHEVDAFIDGKYMPVPFNLNSLNIAFGEEEGKRLREKLLANFEFNEKIPILKLMNHEDKDIRKIADYVYQNVFLKYTMKQWNQKPEEVDKSVTARVPVVISEDNRYFQDEYQGMPKDGYTKIFDKMLKHPNIVVKINVNAANLLEFDAKGVKFDGVYFEGNIVYTGEVDELLKYRFGSLPYRTLRFENEYLEVDSFQPKAVVNYTVSEDFTRITEYKKLTGQQAEGTSIMKEYPMQYTGDQEQIPYYAILSPDNLNKYSKYTDVIDNYDNVFLLGRLAEYKYYNIDAIVRRALDLAKVLRRV